MQSAIDTAAQDATTKAGNAESAAKTYTDGEIDKVEGTIATLQGVVDGKAASSDLTALTGRVSTAEGEIDTLQSEMDAVEAKAAANETAIGTLNTTVASKADSSALTGVSDRVTTLETWHNNFTECSEEEINALFNA
jgi:predicted  nucleic acid-binding Zn-ribbon protein